MLLHVHPRLENSLEKLKEALTMSKVPKLPTWSGRKSIFLIIHKAWEVHVVESL